MTPNQLFEMKSVCKLLSEKFDLSVELSTEISSFDLGFQVKSDEPLFLFASEGSAGVVARSLDELLTLVVHYPYWQDLLKFSGGGDIVLMRLAAKMSEPDLRADEPEIDIARSQLEKALSLDFSIDSIENLHRSLTTDSQLKSVLAVDGHLYG